MVSAGGVSRDVLVVLCQPVGVIFVQGVSEIDVSKCQEDVSRTSARN